MLGINGQQLFNGTLIAGYGDQLNAAIYTGGRTAYGYSVKETAQLYGDLDLNRIFQAEARAGQNARDYGNEASARHSQLLSQAASAQEGVARILAEGESRSRVIRSSALQPSALIERTTTGQGAVGETRKVMPRASDPQSFMTVPLNTEVSPKLQVYVTANCLNCHAPGKERQQTDLTSLGTTNLSVRYAVVEEMAEGSMPKGGTPATDDILQAAQEWKNTGRKTATGR